MNPCAIAIFRNQADNAKKVIDALRVQVGDSLVVVLDRPSDSDRIAFTELGLPHIIESSRSIATRGSGDSAFMAGYCRNLGVTHAVSLGFTDFAFIDGDCIPQDTWFSAHSRLMSVEYPVIGVGRRREKKFGWKDMRESDPALLNSGIFGKIDNLISNPDQLTKSLITWSCNLSVNRKAHSLISRLNGKLYQRTELFSSRFDGEYGGEDSFLGIQAHSIRCAIVTLGESTSGVLHIDHPSMGGSMVDQMKFFQSELDSFRKLTRINRIGLSDLL